MRCHLFLLSPLFNGFVSDDMRRKVDDFEVGIPKREYEDKWEVCFTRARAQLPWLR